MGDLKAAAQDSYPTRNITIVVPFSPGGPADGVARTIAPNLSKILGVPIIIENRAGAANQIAVDYVGRQPADGYTLLLASPSTAMVGIVNMSYTGSLSKDIVGVAGLGVGPLLLISSAKLPVKSFGELLSYGKAHPGEINIGTSGASDILAASALSEMTGLKTVTVRYLGEANLITALLANDVHLAMYSPGGAKQYIESGDVRPLAVTGKTRMSDYPDIPTIAESGFPDFEFIAFFGLMAKAGTPQPIVDKLYRATEIVLRDPKVQAQLKPWGFEISGWSPTELTRFWNDQIVTWSGVAERTGFKPQ
jgi:tripartite-type tricarboxylate transporter receptor subunit TctC